MYLRSYGLAKKRLDKYLKSAVLEYPLRSHMVNALKHISDHHGGTFMIFIDHRSGH